jgi:hypothetical protein
MNTPFRRNGHGERGQCEWVQQSRWRFVGAVRLATRSRQTDKAKQRTGAPIWLDLSKWSECSKPSKGRGLLMRQPLGRLVVVPRPQTDPTQPTRPGAVPRPRPQQKRTKRVPRGRRAASGGPAERPTRARPRGRARRAHAPPPEQVGLRRACRLLRLPVHVWLIVFICTRLCLRITTNHWWGCWYLWFPQCWTVRLSWRAACAALDRLIVQAWTGEDWRYACTGRMVV